MRKSTFIFLTAAVLSIGIIVYGWTFVDKQVGEAVLTEETIMGDRSSADGLTVGFRADSADDLHWDNTFSYSTDTTISSFKRGEMEKKDDRVIYDNVRFTGWSAVPFYTQIKYDKLDGLQDKKIHSFYEDLQKEVLAEEKKSKGTIRLCDYLDYYPVSFNFRFGGKAYNSDNALRGLKSFADKGTLSEENTAPYEQDIALYKDLNAEFKIPVIDNEYQHFRVSRVEDPDNKRITSAKTTIAKPSDSEKDYYEFDPIITIQEENIKDGKHWNHPDMSESLSYDGDYHGGEKASDYGLKNRMLFIVNNRTAKGKPVDVSQIKGGYGVYELPIDAAATASIGGKKKKVMVPDPKPLPEQLSMVYPLDENAEYVEISLSGDHRYLAIFSIRDGSYFVEVVDADNWKSVNTSRMFPASKKMTYTWGEDGTLAATDFENHVAILTKTKSVEKPYKMFYCGEIMTGLDEDMFTTEMVCKKNSRSAYEYGIDTGLAVTSTDDRVALVQNSPIESRNPGFRNADLECVVIGRTGVIYIGLLKSNLVDIDYGITEDEINAIEKLADGSMVKNVIKPVGNENWAKWEK